MVASLLAANAGDQPAELDLLTIDIDNPNRFNWILALRVDLYRALQSAIEGAEVEPSSIGEFLFDYADKSNWSRHSAKGLTDFFTDLESSNGSELNIYADSIT